MAPVPTLRDVVLANTDGTPLEGSIVPVPTLTDVLLADEDGRTALTDTDVVSTIVGAVKGDDVLLAERVTFNGVAVLAGRVLFTGAVLLAERVVFSGVVLFDDAGSVPVAAGAPPTQ